MADNIVIETLKIAKSFWMVAGTKLSYSQMKFLLPLPSNCPPAIVKSDAHCTPPHPIKFSTFQISSRKIFFGDCKFLLRILSQAKISRAFQNLQCVIFLVCSWKDRVNDIRVLGQPTRQACKTFMEFTSEIYIAPWDWSIIAHFCTCKRKP